MLDERPTLASRLLMHATCMQVLRRPVVMRRGADALDWLLVIVGVIGGLGNGGASVCACDSCKQLQLHANFASQAKFGLCSGVL